MEGKSSSGGCTCGTILCALLSFACILLLAIGVVAVVLYFVYKPQVPEYDIQHVSVSRLSLSQHPGAGSNVSSPVNITAATLISGIATGKGINSSISQDLGLNAVVNFTIEAHNPNKVALEYKYLNISVLYKGISVGNSSVPSFTQEPQSNTSVPATLSVQDFPLDVATGPTMLADIKSGNIVLQLEIYIGARMSILGVASPFAKVSLSCDVDVDPLKQLVKDTKCSVSDLGLS
eukprot:TRINITY_DN17273_c0_g1_i1.p1 TRINITY_DN17273_c0_g1~~TRINITY_DN17273_c0_g1_i1.p1  ORF type:complete len:234 (-),score=14.69 TRINITY_DN17273_c0_g1_i1:796-1497(-)